MVRVGVRVALEELCRVRVRVRVRVGVRVKWLVCGWG